MDAIPEAERSSNVALASLLFAEHVQERRDVPDGYAFRFPTGALLDVARFLANERRCCPFLSFELTVPPNDDVLWLRITGPPGTRELLSAELPDLSEGRRAA
jgi:hypothetical protein